MTFLRFVEVESSPILTFGEGMRWTGPGRWVGECRAVVRPESADQVARVVAYCGENRVPLVTVGGNTGLVGGAVPSDGAVRDLLRDRRVALILFYSSTQKI